MTAPRVLDDAEVAARLDMDAAIASQREAFGALGDGTAELAPKALLHGDDDTALCYFSRLSPAHAAVCKVVSVNPGNAGRGLPTISATVLVLDPVTGALAAVMDAGTLTAVRTAAGSAVAADALALPGPVDLGVLGSGVQAYQHVRALARVRDLRSVRLWSPNAAHRDAAVQRIAAEVGAPVTAADDPVQAVRGAQVVAACTLSTEPVVPTDAVAPGCLVISVGSFEKHRREVDGALLRRAARVVVDDVATAEATAGCVVAGLAAGDIARDRLVPLGAVVTGRAEGRTDPGDIVFYNSVGLGAQDAAAALAVLRSP
jgi:ornithine cyclodeaminase